MDQSRLPSLSPANRNTARILSLCHAFLAVLSFVYCFEVFVRAAEACYVLPCYEGNGWEPLWKVNKGVTFTGESSGVFALVHSTVGYSLFTYYGNAHTLFIGGLAGCTLCAVLLSVNMIWVWGAEWNLLGDMSLVNPDSPLLEESGRHMAVNLPLIAVFRRLFYLSVSMCVVQGSILLQILRQRLFWLRMFGIFGDDASERDCADEMTPLQIR